MKSLEITSNITAYRFPTAIATCPSGYVATGGGGNCISHGYPVNGKTVIGWVFIATSNKVAGSNQWQVSCVTPQGQDVTAQATVICF